VKKDKSHLPKTGKKVGDTRKKSQTIRDSFLFRRGITHEVRKGEGYRGTPGGPPNPTGGRVSEQPRSPRYRAEPAPRNRETSSACIRSGKLLGIFPSQNFGVRTLREVFKKKKTQHRWQRREGGRALVSLERLGNAPSSRARNRERRADTYSGLTHRLVGAGQVLGPLEIAGRGGSA